MARESATAISTPSTVAAAGRLAWFAEALFLILLLALHILEPELDPSWRLISEYAIGRFGWLMAFAFLLSAFGCLSLFVAIRPTVRGGDGKVGQILLLASAAGMLIAALFPTDPITATGAAVTTTGILHRLGALGGILTFAPAAALLSRSLVRSAAWSSARVSLAWTVAFVWLSLLAFVLSMAVMFRGSFGPEVPVGWSHRIMMVANSAWLMTVAQQVLRLQRGGARQAR